MTNNAFKKQWFVNHPVSYYFYFELFFNLVHPSPFLKSISYKIYNQELNMFIDYEINDILVILSHTKIILILLHFFSITKYNSSKMQRIIFLFKYDETNLLLPIKAYVKNHPVQIMLYSFFFSIFYFSAIIIGRPHQSSSGPTRSSTRSCWTSGRT